jgi:hypothetical protein
MSEIAAPSWELSLRAWTCHYERSEESAFVCGWIDAWRKEQIPHRLKSVRDDKNEWPRTAHLKVRPFKSSHSSF